MSFTGELSLSTQHAADTETERAREADMIDCTVGEVNLRRCGPAVDSEWDLDGVWRE